MRDLVILFWIAILPFHNFVFSQVPCDTAKAKAALARSAEFFGKEETEPALDSALLALKILGPCRHETSLFQSSCMQAEKCCRTLANECMQKGLFNRSIDYSERGIALHQQMSAHAAMDLSDTYMNLSRAHALNGNQQLAIEAALKGLKERQNANPSDLGVPAFYEQIATNYTMLGDIASARQYLNDWESFHQKIGDKATPENKIRLAISWASLYEKKNDLPSAVKTLEDTLNQYREQLKTRRSLMVGIAEFHLCELYAKKRDFRKAFEYADKNIVALETRIKQQKGRLFSRSHYGWYLAQSARAAWNIYLESKDSSWYRIAEQRCAAGENIVFEMRDRAPDDGFRDWVANNAGSLAEVRYGLYAQTGNRDHIERAFATFEACKMFSVQQFLHETYALQWGGLPDSLYAQETQLRQAVNDLEMNFFMVRMRPNADSLIAANDQKLFALRDQYRVFLAGLEKNQPEYFRLKYSQPKASIQQVQKQTLRSGQCLLDLFIENGLVFALLIRPDTVACFSTPYDSTQLASLETLENESRHFAKYQNLPEKEYLSHLQSYADASYLAYQMLIAPLRPLLLEEVLLIPRDELANLPFGALLTQPEANMGKPFLWHFLDNELVISQTYAVGLFQFVQNRPVAQKPAGSVLALAPFYEGKISEDLKMPVGDVAALTRADIFKPLPGSGTEAQSIAQLTNGLSLVGSKATKANFLKNCQGYNILHFATHSAANEVLGEYSFVALQAENAAQKIDLLYARDIYGLRLSADLVVLSACETAQGQYRKDEGIVGLTRAFTCAGARNVIASLWSVNDASTQRLMVLFYKETVKGMPYNRALANAKRALIKENRQFAHPFYWAGFVLNGR